MNCMLPRQVLIADYVPNNNSVHYILIIKETGGIIYIK